MMPHEREFDRELDGLKKKLLEMAAIAENMIDCAVKSLSEQDEGPAASIPPHEDRLNRLQLEIDDEAIRLLAIRQPVASDLRFIVTATRINGELERIGDLVMNIIENVRRLSKQPLVKPLIDIPKMAALTRQMVRESLDSFVQEDVLLAQAVIMSDDNVDALKEQIVNDLIPYKKKDPDTVERSLALILIARHLERIADHAVNMAEDSIYMIQGRDVRHPDKHRDSAPENAD